MGHFSRQTGFPTLRVTVAGRRCACRTGAGTDFLMIGTGDDQPAFDKLGNSLPVALRSGQIQVHDTQGLFRADTAPGVVEGASRTSIRIAET